MHSWRFLGVRTCDVVSYKRADLGHQQHGRTVFLGPFEGRHDAKKVNERTLFMALGARGPTMHDSCTPGAFLGVRTCDVVFLMEPYRKSDKAPFF